MDLGKLAQDTLGQMMSDSTNSSKSNKKKTTKKTTNNSGDIVSGIEDNVDTALKSKLPKSPITDLATGVLDQNKDGHIVDDLVRMGENLLKKKK